METASSMQEVRENLILEVEHCCMNKPQSEEWADWVLSSIAKLVRDGFQDVFDGHLAAGISDFIEGK